MSRSFTHVVRPGETLALVGERPPVKERRLLEAFARLRMLPPTPARSTLILSRRSGRPRITRSMRARRSVRLSLGIWSSERIR